MEEERVLDLTDYDQMRFGPTHEKVEYFRKRGRLIGDQIVTDARSGDRLLIPCDGKTRGKGKMKGVMVAYVPDDDDVVRIGFSMCHPNDRWDYIKGVHIPGWGKQIATERAEKWVIKNFAYKYAEFPETIEKMGMTDEGITSRIKESVVIPDSMYESLCTFVQRCRKYYKDKRFPVWTNRLPEA